MESPRKQPSTCDCCQDLFTDEPRLIRRDFLKTASGVAVGAGALAAGLPIGRVWARPMDTTATAATTSPESLVKVLYDALSPKQREAICFAWNHQDPERGLLRTRVAANWDITDYFVVDDDFYTKDQQHIIRGIYEGIINPEWHSRIDKQLEDDAGGYGEQNSIAIFGEPGTKKFEFVMTGRHMTIRCDGNSAEHVAFGGPIFYGHAADGFNEVRPTPATSSGPRPKRRTSSTRCSTSRSATRRWCAAACPKRTRRLPRQAGEVSRPGGDRALERSEGAPPPSDGASWSSPTARATATKPCSASRRKAASTLATSPTSPKRHRQRRRLGHLAARRPVVRLALPRRPARARLGQRRRRPQRETQRIGIRGSGPFFGQQARPWPIPVARKHGPDPLGRRAPRVSLLVSPSPCLLVWSRAPTATYP